MFVGGPNLFSILIYHQGNVPSTHQSHLRSSLDFVQVHGLQGNASRWCLAFGAGDGFCCLLLLLHWPCGLVTLLISHSFGSNLLSFLFIHLWQQGVCVLQRMRYDRGAAYVLAVLESDLQHADAPLCLWLILA